MHSILATALAFLVALGIAFSADAGNDLAARMLAAANRARAEQGLPLLTIDSRLAGAAQERAEALAAAGLLSHVEPDGTGLEDRLARAGYIFRLAAENLGEGLASPEDTVAMWLQSPGHRKNILLPSPTQAGIGHAAAERGTERRHYWVLILGEPLPPGHN